MNALLCLLELMIAGALIGVYFPQTTPLPNSPLVLGSCFSKSPPDIAVVLIAPLTFETYLAFLALRKSFQDNARRAVGKRTSLMSLLIRDNIIYFFLIAGTLIAVTIGWFFWPVSPGNSLITFTHVSGSIGGSRLIINVRHVAHTMEHGDDQDDGMDDPAMLSRQAALAYELPIMRPPASQVGDDDDGAERRRLSVIHFRKHSIASFQVPGGAGGDDADSLYSSSGVGGRHWGGRGGTVGSFPYSVRLDEDPTLVQLGTVVPHYGVVIPPACETVTSFVTAPIVMESGSTVWVSASDCC